MSEERDQYREVYRSAREGLSLLSDLLTEPERDAILREATRTARKKENFWTFVSLVGGGVVYFIFDGISSIHHLKTAALVGYLVTAFALATIKNRRSRIVLIAKEVMAILKRKKIRPPRCLCCNGVLMDDGLPKCADCGCDLAIETRPRH